MKLFGSIFNDVKVGKFLPQNYHGDKYYIHNDGDDEKSYRQNLLKTPDDWEYKTKKVKYTTNKNKYRTIEFKKIDWSNSVVLFGCSNVFGVGLNDSDTISYNLSKLIDRPVINMGNPGTSIEFNFHNNLILKNHYPTPYAVVNIWPSYIRSIIYSRHTINNLGPWNVNDTETEILFKDDYHLRTEGYFHIIGAQSLWQTTTKYIDLTMYSLNKKHYGLEYIDWVDRARDLLHPGSQTSKLVAEYIGTRL